MRGSDRGFRSVAMSVALAVLMSASPIVARGAPALTGGGSGEARQKPARESVGPKVEAKPEKTSTDYMSSALLYHKLGRYDQAIADISKAIEIDGEIAGYHVLRGVIRARNGDFGPALVDSDKAISLDPKLVEAYLLRGECYEGLMKSDEAVKAYTQAIEVDPKGSNAYRKRGACYRSAKKLDQALKDLDRAIELNRESASAYFERGFCHLERKEPMETMADWGAAADLDADQEESLRVWLVKLGEKIRQNDKTPVRFLAFTPDPALKREVVGRSAPTIVPEGTERKWSGDHTLGRRVSMTDHAADPAAMGLIRAWWEEVERGCRFVEAGLSENRGDDPVKIRREMTSTGDGRTAFRSADVVLFRTGKVKMKVGETTYTVPVRYETDYRLEVEKVVPELTEAIARTKFMGLIAAGDIEAALDFGEKLLEKFKDDGTSLNNIFFDPIDLELKNDPDPRIARLALKALKRAEELTKGQDMYVQDTLAVALFRTGDPAGACAAEEKAIEILRGAEPSEANRKYKKTFEDQLTQFRKAAGKPARR